MERGIFSFNSCKIWNFLVSHRMWLSGSREVCENCFWWCLSVLIICIPLLWVWCYEKNCWSIRSCWYILRCIWSDIMVKYYCYTFICLGHHCMFSVKRRVLILPFYPIIGFVFVAIFFLWIVFINGFSLIHSTNIFLFLYRAPLAEIFQEPLPVFHLLWILIFWGFICCG